jgi:hypothetical protein
MILRVWIDGDPPSLRARITRTLDIERPLPETIGARTREDIHGAVQDWLEAYLDETP